MPNSWSCDSLIAFARPLCAQLLVSALFTGVEVKVKMAQLEIRLRYLRNCASTYAIGVLLSESNPGGKNIKVVIG